MTTDQIDKLRALGFFKHEKASDLPRVLATVDERGDAFADETKRSYLVDAEDLAEGGFLAVLGCVAPFLRREGVAIEARYAPVRCPRVGRSLAHHHDCARRRRLAPDRTRLEVVDIHARRSAPRRRRRPDGGLRESNILHIGSRDVMIVDAASSEDSRSQASNALLSVLSQWLETYGSAERAYGRHEGNDFTVVFATPALAETQEKLKSFKA